MLIRHCLTLAVFATLFATMALGSAFACSVPVFRYALERWEPDPYLVLVFYQDRLDDATAELVAQLESAAADSVVPANCVVQPIDVEGEMSEALRKVWQPHAMAPLPWVVVRYPLRSRIDADVWSGPADSVDVLSLLDSPLRSELARRLVGGQTAVWLLLESSDAQANDAAAQLLDRELARLTTTLKLPELAAEDASLITADGPELKIAFSQLRLTRNDPKEQTLVHMLLASEEDLSELDEPMVFAVFGRGRAHWALVGAGISPENIAELATFLVGECSCEVKDQNPGVDLLLAAAWDQLQGTFVVDESLPPLVGLPGVVDTPMADGQRFPEAADGSSETTQLVSERSLGSLSRNMLLAGGVLLLIVVAGAWWVRATAGKSQ